MSFRYVAVGSDGGIFLSNSLDSWFLPESNPAGTGAFRGVRAGNGYFMAAHNDGEEVYRSVDGQTWEPSAFDFTYDRFDWTHFSKEAGYFHIIGSDKHWRSVDALNWVEQYLTYDAWYQQGSPIYEESNDLYYVTGSRELVVLRDQGDGTNDLVVDDCGVEAGKIAYGNGYYVITGRDDNYSVNWVVSRGTTIAGIEVLFTDTSNDPKYETTFFNGYFYGVDNNNGVWRSTYGDSWYLAHEAANRALSITHLEEAGVLVVGGENSIAYSEDGFIWYDIELPQNPNHSGPDDIYRVAARDYVVNFWFGFAGTREVL